MYIINFGRAIGYFFCNGTTLQIARQLAYFADAREKAGLPLFDQPISLD